MVVRHLDHRLPAETRRIVNEMHFWLRPTVEYYVEPVILLEAVCRLVLIVAECDFTDGCAPFHFDESDVGKGLVVVLVRLPRNYVEASIVFFHALDQPAALDLVP